MLMHERYNYTLIKYFPNCVKCLVNVLLANFAISIFRVNTLPTFIRIGIIINQICKPCRKLIVCVSGKFLT